LRRYETAGSSLSGQLYFFDVETIKKGVTDHLAMLAKIQADKDAKAAQP